MNLKESKEAIIKGINARKVYDNRTRQQLEVEVHTEKGFGRASAPAGAAGSTGKFEPEEYPEGGVDEAIKIVENEISEELKGMDALSQVKIDKKLEEIDPTPLFGRIGGNTATAVSNGVAKAAADYLQIPLYQYLGAPLEVRMCYPLSNTIGGGSHAGRGAAPDMQEHHLIPVTAENQKEANQIAAKGWQKTREYLQNNYSNYTGGSDDEGSLVPGITDWEALEVLTKMAEELEDETGHEIRLGIDVAAVGLWDEDEEVYKWPTEGVERTTGEQIEHMKEIAETFPMYFMEDMFHDDDFKSHAEIKKKYGDEILVCGDDLTADTYERLEKAIELDAINSIVVKVNMTGTLTETYRVVNLAHKNGITPVKSCRSGETEDTIISQLAVAWGCPLHKFAFAQKGAPKANELMRIEEHAGEEVAKKPLLPFYED